MAGNPARSRAPRSIYLILAALAAVRLWIMPIGSSFWLDEAGTFSLLRKSLGETIAQAVAFSGQSIGHTVIEWFATFVLGRSEAAMRAPSVAATFAAAALLYHLGARFFDREAALLAVVAFVAHPQVAFAAADARAYAIAILIVIASMLMLIRWLERGRLADALGFALLAALIPYMHYLWADMFAVFALTAICYLRAGTPVAWPRMLAVACLIALLLLPLVGPTRQLMAFRSMLAGGQGARVADLFPHLPSNFYTFPIFASLALAFLLWRGVHLAPPLGTRTTLLVLLNWAVIPVLVLFVYSAAIAGKVFLARYFLCAAPAAALLVGWALRRLEPAKVRVLAAVILTCSSLIAYGGSRRLWTNHGAEDWRGALATVRGIVGSSNMPVLVRAAFIEGGSSYWRSDPARFRQLLTPVTVYPTGGNVIPLPYAIDDEATPYIENVVTTIVEPSDRFVLVNNGGETPYELWMDVRLRGLGFKATPVGSFQQISVTLYERGITRR